MPFNGNGVFNLDFSWPNDAANGIPITAQRVQDEDQNIADGLSNVICRDGQSVTTASIPFAQGLNVLSISQLTGTTTGIPIQGTGTTNNAASGIVGEYMSASASNVSLVSTVVSNVASVSLTAGDWDVTGLLQFGGSSTAAVRFGIASVSILSQTIDSGLDRQAFIGDRATPFADGGAESLAIPSARFSLSATTTVYLVGELNFTSTAVASGAIHARRMR